MVIISHVRLWITMGDRGGVDGLWFGLLMVTYRGKVIKTGKMGCLTIEQGCG